MKAVGLEDLLAMPAGPGRGKQILAVPGLRVTLIRLAKGEVMPEHPAPGPITIHALVGRIDLHAAGERVPLRPGTIVCLEEKTPHRLEALDDSAFLLTIGSPGGVLN